MERSLRTTALFSAHRRGATYFIVLMAVTLVVTIGLSSVLLARVEMRTSRNAAHWQGAALLAYAGVDHAAATLNATPAWRTTFANEVPIADIALGDGTIAWMLEDVIDSSLDDNNSDPVRIHGIGRVGEATRAVSVVAFPSGAPLDVLRTAAHSSGDLDVKDGAIVKRGPLSSNTEIRVDTDMLLSGSVEAGTLDNRGTITGTITVPAPAKPMPASALYDIYKNMSARISYPPGGTLENGVIAPTINAFDPDLNAAGLYSIDVNGSPISPKSLTIRNCRIVGTLIVKLKANSTLEIADGVVWEPASPAYPALIVYADSDISSNVTIGGSGVLSESTTGVNFNPPELPYNGQPGDIDTLDDYDSVLRGVFHVIRKAPIPTTHTVIDGSDRIVGCVIVDGKLDLENAPNLETDARFLTSPPLGYSKGDEMRPLAATWQYESVPN